MDTIHRLLAQRTCHPKFEEKRAVGAVWESRNNGQCLFVMPQGQDWDAIKKKVSD